MNDRANAGVVMDVRVGEELTLDLAALLAAVASGAGLSLGPITVKVERKDGQRARLRVVADQRIKVSRPPPRVIPAKAG
jgi:hypothetical protein